MCAIELRLKKIRTAGDDSSDEELRAVGVGSSVGHGQQSRLGVAELEVFVLELFAVDGLAAGAWGGGRGEIGQCVALFDSIVGDGQFLTVTAGEVTTLEHELGDHAGRKRGVSCWSVWAKWFRLWKL